MIQEQVVTEEMINAGFEVLSRSGIADEYLEADKLLLVEIYQAMTEALRSGLSNKDKIWNIS